MYVVTVIPQVDGTYRYCGLRSRRAAASWRRLIADDPAMVEALRPDQVCDCPRGRRPRGWVDA